MKHIIQEYFKLAKSIWFWIFVLLGALLLLGLLGADWNRVYAYVGDEIKFIKADTNIGPTYINVAHIVSIRKTNAVGQEGTTEIALINGTEFYSPESLDQIVSRIIEK